MNAFHLQWRISNSTFMENSDLPERHVVPWIGQTAQTRKNHAHKIQHQFSRGQILRVFFFWKFHSSHLLSILKFCSIWIWISLDKVKIILSNNFLKYFNDFLKFQISWTHVLSAENYLVQIQKVIDSKLFQNLFLAHFPLSSRWVFPSCILCVYSLRARRIKTRGK